MYCNWTEAIERGECSGVMMLDLSAAFDLVNHSILLQKLALIGFEETALKWCKSYLEGRYQCVYVDGQFSELQSIEVGVPQGSVLGALFYILFVNDLPGVIHDTHINEEEHEGQNPWKRIQECDSCGALCCYVDDSTYTFSSTNAEDINSKLSKQFKKLSEYFRDNRLVVNDTKTQLVVVGTMRHQKIREAIQVETGTVSVIPVESGKLLGVNIHQSLKWKYHVITAESSMVKCLTGRLNCLRLKASNASFKTRLMLANAYFMSSLVYAIVIWGGAEKYVIKTLQVLQNRVARYVARQSWFTPTRTLLKHCGWLSVRQLIAYHSILQIWKILYLRRPSTLTSRLQLTNNRSRANSILALPPNTTHIGKNSFIVRAAHHWNSLPTELRTTSRMETFKKKLKHWIHENIEID